MSAASLALGLERLLELIDVCPEIRTLPDNLLPRQGVLTPHLAELRRRLELVRQITGWKNAASNQYSEQRTKNWTSRLQDVHQG